MYRDEQWREHVIWRPVAGVVLRELAGNPTLGRLRVLTVKPVLATADELEEFAPSPLVGRLTGLWLWVQFVDGEREELEADGGIIRDAITGFLSEHGHRLPREEAPPG
jgi:hypothetical protein